MNPIPEILSNIQYESVKRFLNPKKIGYYKTLKRYKELRKEFAWLEAIKKISEETGKSHAQITYILYYLKITL